MPDPRAYIDEKFSGVAEDMGYSQEAKWTDADGRPVNARIKKVTYSQDAVIDVILSNPAATQRELAALIGVSEAWMSRVIGSSAFQARLYTRREGLVDPVLAESIKDRLQGVVTQSLEVIAEKLEAGRSFDQAARILDIGTRALGYGIKTESNVQNNFVVRLPDKFDNEQDWAAAARRVATVIPPATSVATVKPVANEEAVVLEGAATVIENQGDQEKPRPAESDVGLPRE